VSIHPVITGGVGLGCAVLAGLSLGTLPGLLYAGAGLALLFKSLYDVGQRPGGILNDDEE